MVPVVTNRVPDSASDDQGAFHTCLQVSRDPAYELVGARLYIKGHEPRCPDRDREVDAERFNRERVPEQILVGQGHGDLARFDRKTGRRKGHLLGHQSRVCRLMGRTTGS
jgi:hypothetical protein